MPDTPLKPSPFASILSMSGGNRLVAVGVVLQWQWEACKQFLMLPARDEAAHSQRAVKGPLVSREDLATDLATVSAPRFSQEQSRQISLSLFEYLEQIRLCWKTKLGETVVSSKALEPLRLMRSVCKGSMSDENVRYFVFAHFRSACSCSLSSETAGWFHGFASTLNQDLRDRLPDSTSKRADGMRHESWNYSEDVLPLLRAFVSRIVSSPEQQERAIMAFLHTARAVKYLQVGVEPGSLACLTREFDAEYLISSLFGLPTRMRGFDQLFGGGLLLVEDSPSKARSWVAASF